ncbi:MAG TPA: tagaturonate epimerase family protein [bacterium]|nr:tagaturonate epimerase family protein [bacterium]HPN43722.1 tagaturonate epimerase family protein [bacterium]
MFTENKINEIISLAVQKEGLEIISVYPGSLQKTGDSYYIMIKTLAGRTLFCFGSARNKKLHGDAVTVKSDGEKLVVQICPCNHENADALRQLFPWTAPRYIGAQPSFGAGDRLGLAAAGHIRALKKYRIAPVLAQQSVREMTRTLRSADEVLDDVTWGVFQEGYTGGYGADADHIKSEEDLRNLVAAGFTGFTIDPSAHLNPAADTMDISALPAALAELFDEEQEISEFLDKYSAQDILVKGKTHSFTLFINDVAVTRLAIKYLPAIRHTIKCFYIIKQVFGNDPFDFEMSVDETESPTTAAAHYIIANELVAAGVKLTSLAPRFPGEFQKAIDYIGDLYEFRAALADHAAIAERFGGYKISIHSGSDKFSIFAAVHELTGGYFHEKTAGTSYLEALRVICRFDKSLFRDIVKYALKSFAKERSSYHVTTDLTKIADVNKLADSDLETLLSENNARQVLHITYGAILTAKDKDEEYRFRNHLLGVLDEHEEDHYEILNKLICAHLDALQVDKK